MENTIPSKTTVERNLGVDFLRVVSMLMIVGLHVIGNGGLLNSSESSVITAEVVYFMELACYCSVNCFALISGYVGVGSKHKLKNVVFLSAQSIFYCVLFTLIYLVFSLIANLPLDLSFVVKSLVPQFFGRYWYFSAYFCLFFFMPILDYIINIPRDILKRGAVILFVLCCITQVVDNVSSLLKGYSFLWLAILYVVGGYFAKYNPLKKITVGKNLVLFFVCVVITFLIRTIIETYFINIGVLNNAFLVHYTSPTIVFAAIFLFNACINMKISEKIKPIILFLATSSFGVYLIHCQPVVFDCLLKDAFVSVAKYGAIVVIPVIVGIVMAIYLTCTIIDYGRKYVFKLLKIDICCDWLARYIDKGLLFLSAKKTDSRDINI